MGLRIFILSRLR